MNRQKILISQIKQVTDIKSKNLKGIESSQQKIFGYLKNMPGEKNWIKPLMGKNLQNYYFPSKYLHLDFNLKEYLRMQTVRFNKKNIDDSLLKLQECINLIIENKKIIDDFFSKVTKELLYENQSLKDFYFLYLTIFPIDKLQTKSQIQSQTKSQTKTQTKSQIQSFLPLSLYNNNSQNEHFSWFYLNKNNYDTTFSCTSTSIPVPISTVTNKHESISNINTTKFNIKKTIISKDTNKQNEILNNEMINNEVINNEMINDKKDFNPFINSDILNYYDDIKQNKNYKNIIFERTKNYLPFKKIICVNQNDNIYNSKMRQDKSKEMEEIDMEEMEIEKMEIEKLETKEMKIQTKENGRDKNKEKEKDEIQKKVVENEVTKEMKNYNKNLEISKKTDKIDKLDKTNKHELVNLQNEFLKWEDKIYYLHGDVNLGLGDSIDNIEKEKVTEIEKDKEDAKILFYKMINENKDLQKTLSIRNRFVDPLYLRRRYSYIDKLTKKKIKKEKQKTYRKHFIQSADEKKIWPDNKGLLNKKYPNPYS